MVQVRFPYPNQNPGMRPDYPDGLNRSMQIVNIEDFQTEACKINPFGMSPVDTEGGTTKYPPKLIEGGIIALGTLNYANADQNAAMRVGAGVGTDIYAYAADATADSLWLIYTANQPKTHGVGNNIHTYNTATQPDTPIFNPSSGVGTKPTVNPTYQINGKSSVVTGLGGDGGKIWITAINTTEEDLTNYTVGTELTVSKGRWKIAVAGEYIKGKVLRRHQEGTLYWVQIKVLFNSLAIKA